MENKTYNAVESMKKACVMAHSTIEHIMQHCGEELTDIEIDKVLDAVRIIDMCKKNGVA